MNILMICTEKLPVPNIRGGAIQTYIGGAVGLLKAQHNITIIGRDDPELASDERVDGVRYLRFESNGALETYMSNMLPYLAAGGTSYDVVHIFNRPRLVMPISEIMPNARIVLSMHNDMFNPHKLAREEGDAVVERVDTIITISNYIGAAICKDYPQAESKIRTVYSGVDLGRFAPWKQSRAALKDREDIRAQHGLGNKKVILFVGRLSRNKGPHVLVRAMSQVKHSDAVLVIVGAAWYSDDRISDYIAYLRAMAETSPLPVMTTGYVQASDVHKWFCAADMFVCTSIWEEPLARVHYEAMAAGLPLITTARGGNPEIIRGNNGVIVENPEDPAEYATKINAMLSNLGESRQMGLNGRKLTEDNFTWSHVAGNILEVWNSPRVAPSSQVVEASSDSAGEQGAFEAEEAGEQDAPEEGEAYDMDGADPSGDESL
ncbi:glycosyltransferase family 4 protein [Paenibacillus sp. PAMC21692]|uniref:glycosyltransferase family 4 protein n=1 Tax=Paenibacillus sp. PAMC21692 TaxID=2762320 RepID=UPI00164DFC17|nr:glycosyltransferase family 4 protein [Paenibacillus sp. PAMC21692]QNK57683.1 glycosyltransferase family 4 protein [Paenibacillus sp. PAMC21692]